MPGVSFVLPHWFYWIGLIVFPLIAIYLSRRTRSTTSRNYSKTTAYFIWCVGGFLGLHRFYLRNLWGFLYIPLFIFILYSSSAERQARVIVSDARAELEAIDSSINRNQKRLDKAVSQIQKFQDQLIAIPAEETSRIDRLNKRIDKQDKQIAKAREQIATDTSAIGNLQASLKEAESQGEFWSEAARYAFYLVLLLLLVDAFAIPKLTRKANRLLESQPQKDASAEALESDSKFVAQGFPGILDRISLLSGEFVAFWSILAVFAYYYEVVVRYVFNSPTNWVHESMFLMFGMQYLIAGSYAMLTESHVRVDIFYAKFSPRLKALVDLCTSVFFFIFAFALLATGWIFASDSMQGGDWTKWEVSFTEWGIQYWPVKITIAIGALLLILQGISKICKDIAKIINPKNA